MIDLSLLPHQRLIGFRLESKNFIYLINYFPLFEEKLFKNYQRFLRFKGENLEGNPKIIKQIFHLFGEEENFSLEFLLCNQLFSYSSLDRRNNKEKLSFDLHFWLYRHSHQEIMEQVKYNTFFNVTYFYQYNRIEMEPWEGKVAEISEKINNLKKIFSGLIKKELENFQKSNEVRK